jgi:general secretion pathway protein L
MADLNATQSAAGQQWSQFLDWWKQHLWECIPAGWRARTIQARRPAMWAPVTDQVWAPGASVLEAQTFTRSALAQRGGSVALVAGDASGFRRVVELPIAVAGRLQQVLSFELDRLTPLRAADLYYDFRVLDRDAAVGNCRVEVVAVPRARIAPWLADAQQKNIEVTRLILAPSDIDTSLNLLVASQDESETSSRYRWLNTALAALCVALVIALIAFPLWQMRQRVIELQPLEATAKTDAEAANIVQRQLEKQIGEYNLPLARKHGSPLVVQIIDDLTKRLPDDTWAQSFEIKTGPNPKDQKDKMREVIVQGETGSGGKILQMFQESPLLKDPVFKATMTRVAPNAERFHVSGELMAAQLPKSLLLSDASAVITVPGLTVVPTAPAGAPASAKAAPSSATLTPSPSSTGTPAVAPPPATPPTPSTERRP